nr:FUSC family protein [uncultured Flavobacterium sp.]
MIHKKKQVQLKDIPIFKKLFIKVNDDHFYNGLKITFCAVVIFAFFFKGENYSRILGMILGLSLASPIDISSSLKDKISGLALAAVTVPIITLLLSYVYNHVILFYVIFSLLVFISALISIYGLRANQFSFMLLLGISLSFLDISNTENSLFNSLNMFYGGCIYFVVSLIFYLIRPNKYIDLQLAICIEHISDYLRLRSKLWEENPDVDAIEEQQLVLQVKINQSFQLINQFLEENKKRIINSAHNRKVILASSFINEIMELALSTTFKNKDIQTQTRDQSKIKTEIKDITNCFATTLNELSENIKLKNKFQPTNDLIQSFGNIKNQINQIQNLDNEKQLYLNNILDYLDNQVKKIRALERVFSENISVSDISVNQQDLQKYFSPKQYRFKTLLENLSFKSIYFKYATRLTLAMLVALFIGSFFQFKQEYWILSTIVLIMQPGYGLTKNRMNQRVVGTIIAGLLGICILFFTSNSLTLAVLTTLAMLFSAWFSSSNYKLGVVFNTLYMILLFGILKTGVELNVFQRVIDTMLGAVIAFLATNYLWPSWEFLSIKPNLIISIQSAKNYINTFRDIYMQKSTDELALQDSRQNAFISVGNLMQSYQRMVQEPKDKQQNRAQLYEIAIINQSLIGAVASLGNFIRAHQDNDSFKMFTSVINTVIYNLDLSLNCFDKKIAPADSSNICTSEDVIQMQANQEKQIQTVNQTDRNQLNKLDESQLVLTQLAWLINLSEQILKNAKMIK